MKFRLTFNILETAACVLALGACSGLGVQEARETQPTGGVFETTLHG